MPTQEQMQSCSKRYSDAANLRQGLASLVGWIGIIGAIALFIFSFIDAFERELGIMISIGLTASSGLIILLGKLVKHQCDVINTILEVVNEQNRS